MKSFGSASICVPGQTLYLTGARWKGGDRRNVQNLQLIHVPVQYDGGSVHISGPGRRVHLRKIVIDELADDRSFPHSGSTDDCDTQRLHHSWSTSSAPWTARTTTADVTQLAAALMEFNTRRPRRPAASKSPQPGAKSAGERTKRPAVGQRERKTLRPGRGR